MEALTTIYENIKDDKSESANSRRAMLEKLSLYMGVAANGVALLQDALEPDPLTKQKGRAPKMLSPSETETTFRFVSSIKAIDIEPDETASRSSRTKPSL